jgi:hypothetical protein
MCLTPGATAVIIIRTGVSVPIPMAEVAAMVVGTGGAMVEVGDGEGMSTMALLMGNGEAAAAEMGMDLHTSSMPTSQPTLGPGLRCLL